ncbi:MAG: hypothetical protein DMF01_05425 [Verrucomicrobia bacterium]|nr:MAG: hypothetical protein DMF01_05425 [Verrucomicrobiota bacterium]
MGSVNSGHHPPIFWEQRCDDASHSKSTSCEINQKYPCVMRQLWECARVLASLSPPAGFKWEGN